MLYSKVRERENLKKALVIEKEKAEAWVKQVADSIEERGKKALSAEAQKAMTEAFIALLRDAREQGAEYRPENEWFNTELYCMEPVDALKRNGVDVKSERCGDTHISVMGSKYAMEIEENVRELDSNRESVNFIYGRKGARSIKGEGFEVVVLTNTMEEREAENIYINREYMVYVPENRHTVKVGFKGVSYIKYENTACLQKDNIRAMEEAILNESKVIVNFDSRVNEAQAITVNIYGNPEEYYNTVRARQEKDYDFDCDHEDEYYVQGLNTRRIFNVHVYRPGFEGASFWRLGYTQEDDGEYTLSLYRKIRNEKLSLETNEKF
jgi:hypothetical protein